MFSSPSTTKTFRFQYNNNNFLIIIIDLEIKNYFPEHLIKDSIYEKKIFFIPMLN